MPTLTLGFSPCPNDTFIFDALVNHKIDTGGIKFDIVIADVEELNRRAFEGSLAITKLSYHALGHLLNQYELLNAGSALGNNCGPLLVAKRPIAAHEMATIKVAIPGRYTTANFLLGLAFPKLENKVELLFSDIENAVLTEKVDAGLIIHENRFTYADRGLVKLIDLGEYWETQTGLPIPLGGIAIKRNLALPLKKHIDQLLRLSVAYAFNQPEQSKAYIKQHAQEMDEQVMYKHIDLYVNKYSLDLGETGKKAVHTLFYMAQQKHLIKPYDGSIILA